MKKYFDGFENYESLINQWNGCNVKDEEVIFAEYNCPPYEGYAKCVFVRDGKVFEVHDSHCSCYGLENWEPEETIFSSILMRTDLSDEIRALIVSAQGKVN